MQLFCVFWKLDQLAIVIEFLFHGNGVKESCNFDNLLHDLTSLIHQKNLPNFQGCWGKMNKLSENFFLKSERANWKKATLRIW